MVIPKGYAMRDSQALLLNQDHGVKQIRDEHGHEQQGVWAFRSQFAPTNVAYRFSPVRTTELHTSLP